MKGLLSNRIRGLIELLIIKGLLFSNINRGIIELLIMKGILFSNRGLIDLLIKKRTF